MRFGFRQLKIAANISPQELHASSNSIYYSIGGVEEVPTIELKIFVHLLPTFNGSNVHCEEKRLEKSLKMSVTYPHNA